MNLLATVGPFAATTTLTIKDEATKLDTNDEEATTVSIPAGATQLKVTLVWTDAAGETLQNDLDLIVTAANGQGGHGNEPAGSPNFDRTNNVEQVVLASPAAGNATITVRAFRVASVAAQPYALVVRVS